jgi:hypothetical protein
VTQGRQQLHRVPGVAERIEHLTQHAQRRLVTVLRSSLRVKKLEHARTCYDHRAGTLGVALRDGMLRAGLVDGEAGLALTGRGREVLGELGADVPVDTRRPLLRDCLDWTERREHPAGAVPA